MSGVVLQAGCFRVFWLLATWLYLRSICCDSFVLVVVIVVWRWAFA